RRRRGLRHLEPGLARELLDGIHERNALALHDEGEGIAVGAAAEAVEAVLVDVETRRLLIVERAAALPLAPRLRQPHAPPDQRRHQGAGAQFLQESGGKRHQPPRFAFTPASLSQSARPSPCRWRRRASPSAPPSPCPCPSSPRHPSRQWPPLPPPRSRRHP